MKHYAEIDGYRLEVGPYWRDYMPEELAEMCNGVGSPGQPPLLAKVLGALPYLLPASRPHDVDYSLGGGWFARWMADRRFRRNCYRVALAQIGSKRDPRWGPAVVEIEGAYHALRLVGWNAFEYHK